MATSLAEEVLNKVSYLSELYHRLIMIVAPAGSGKTQALQEIHRLMAFPLVNVNFELSRRMLDLTERRRTLQVARLLAEIVDAYPTDVVMLDNIELLFEVSLRQDPLRLLQGLSRTKTLVTTWGGTVDSEHLYYAAPGHPEYRRYPLNDLLVVIPETAEFNQELNIEEGLH